MNDLEVLERYRADVGPASARATAVARMGLDELIEGASSGHRLERVRRVGSAPERRRRFAFRYAIAFGVVALLVAGIVLMVDRAVDQRVAAIPTVHLPTGTLAPGPAVGTGSLNVLVVGSDSRAGTPDASLVAGERADTLTLVRITRQTIRSVWIPREIAVTAPDGGTETLGAALDHGPAALVAAVSDALGVPVHHYVALDFGGFASIVDELGGVEVRTSAPFRDLWTGLDLPAGCERLDGAAALALARSRYGEVFVDGSWRLVGQAAPGLTRIANEQVLAAAMAARGKGELDSPAAALDVLDRLSSGLTVDDAFTHADLRTLAGIVLRTSDSATAATLPVAVSPTDPGRYLVVAEGTDVRALLRGDGAPGSAGPASAADAPVIGSC